MTKVEFDASGKATGVTSKGETAKCKKVVCDPSYVPDKVILPQKQLDRKSVMYLFCCWYAHNVAPKGKYIAFVSAEVETDNPQEEVKPGFELLGPVDEIFYDIYDRYVPTYSSTADNCFISTTYDPSRHFESTVKDVLETYTKITGKVLDLSVDLNAASAATEQ